MAKEIAKMQEEILRKMKRHIEFWQEAAKDPKVTIAEREIRSANDIIENIQEATSIMAVRNIRSLLEAPNLEFKITHPSDFSDEIIGVNKDDEVYEIISQYHKYSSGLNPGNSFEDEYLQKVYNALGFEGTLPTHEEIADLERELQNATSEAQKLKIEKEIALKKIALAEGPYGSGFPTRLSRNVEEYYNKYISEEEKKEIMSDQKNEENETTTQITM